MDYVIREAVYKCASLYYDGLISYVTVTQMARDISDIMNVEHREVMDMIDTMYDQWENS